MLFYTFYQPVQVLYGVGSVKQIGEVVKDKGYKKAFIVHDKGVKAVVDKVTAALDAEDIGYTLYDDVIPDPPSYLCDKGYKVFEKSGADCVLAVGGGSSIDTAKGINILRFNEGPILRYLDPENEIKYSPGLIVFPTTSGTGSEVTNALILSNPETHEKKLIICMNAMPEVCVLDPEVLTALPKGITMSTGSDALAHLVESYTTTFSNKMTHLIGEKFIEVVAKWLPVAVEDGSNLEARENMHIAATAGGWMLSIAFAHVGHSIAHALGGTFGMVHGNACAYVDPYVLNWLAPELPDRVKKIGEFLGAQFNGSETPQQIGEKTRDAYLAFNDKIGLPPIETLNCDTSKLESMADVIVEDQAVMFCPKKVTREDVISLLNQVFHIV